MCQKYAGSCGCGKVTFIARGLPKRVGICHCLACQKLHGSAFYWFAVYGPEQVEIEGEVSAWQSSPGYSRAFCTQCGAHVFAIALSEIEISPASLSTDDFPAPQYECWTIRRRAWLPALPVPQFEKDRVEGKAGLREPQGG